MNSVWTAFCLAVMVVVPWVKTVTVALKNPGLFETVATDKSELSKFN